MLIPFATSEPFLIAESVGIVILVFLAVWKKRKPISGLNAQINLANKKQSVLNTLKATGPTD